MLAILKDLFALKRFQTIFDHVLDGIIATMYDSRTLHSREVLERVVDAFGEKVFETVIGRTVKFPDASVSGTPITSYAPEHPAAKAYRQLARELIARGAVA